MIKNPELKAKFDNLIIAEKYAYIFTLELFFRFLQNRIESDDDKDHVAVTVISLLINEILEYLGFEDDDIDKAMQFSEESIIPPLVILQSVKDKTIFNSLLDTCSAIVESTTGELNGMDRYSFAKQVLYENFGALGFSKTEIEESIERVHKSGLI